MLKLYKKIKLIKNEIPILKTKHLHIYACPPSQIAIFIIFKMIVQPHLKNNKNICWIRLQRPNTSVNKIISDSTDMSKNTQLLIQNSSLLLCVVTLTTTTVK